MFMNGKLMKVWRAMKDDDINVQYNEDNNEQGYLIFDSTDDHSDFIGFANGVLGYDVDHSEYELGKELEVELVYSDEYSACSDCNAVIHTLPTHYPDFFVGDGYIACNVCFNDSEHYQSLYLDERINNPKKANQIVPEDKLQNLGFKKFNSDSYESGLHKGQYDNSEEIYKKLDHLYYEVLFSISSESQFSIEFDVWVRGEID